MKLSFSELKYKLYKWVHNDYYYAVRDYFFPYNVIKIQALPRSWTDRCEVLFHASFQILCDFFEREHPLEIETADIEKLYAAVEERHQERLKFAPDRFPISMKQVEEIHHCELTAVQLYDWYKKFLTTPYMGWNQSAEYSVELELEFWNKYDSEMFQKAVELSKQEKCEDDYNVMYHLERLVTNQIDEKLHQLISIRGWLWT